MIAFRVVDTATFIEAGRKVNGELYDYSESVFSGWKNPILIGCNRCGKRVILKNAASHYLKGCGCKACNMEKKHACNRCGKETMSPGFWKRNKKCQDCHDLSKNKWIALAKKEARSKLRFTAWERKCRSVVGSFSKRSVSACGIDRKMFCCWGELIEHQLRRELWEKGCTTWEAKCMNAAKSLRKRRLKV